MQNVKDILIGKIGKKGKITFAEFMSTALYHPEYGYYNTNTKRVGKHGDYYTSPTVHAVFGELIAKQLEEMWSIMGKGVFTVVEMGANAGWLCYDIMRCIMKEFQQLYEQIQYIIVESNSYATEKQRLLLNPLGLAEEKVSWHTYTKSGFSFDSIQGCFLANEFIDALPVHRYTVKKGIFNEIFIGYNGVNFCEIENEVFLQTFSNYLKENFIHLEENQRFEINFDAAIWLKHVAEKLTKGFIITIDYGDTADRIYGGNYKEGTLRCYYKHTVNQDYHERPGQQDITAHVDFTHMMKAGEEADLHVTGFTKQGHYLIALGILERLNKTGNDVNTILKAKNLFHPEGMGDIFKILIQHKNIENPRLSGFRPLSSVNLEA
ncbi:MAG: SAM-dependent methyltransferase [Candidatus Brocadiaceae bacterium]|nr:SAM-dependent methyltransferase [Candidatus Brocadiaceae bacterium]